MTLTLLRLALLQLIQSLANAYHSDYAHCTFDFVDDHNISVSYNLSLFTLTEDAYYVDDASDEISDEVSWIYTFNICGSIPAKVYANEELFPPMCYNTSGPCTKTSQVNGQTTCEPDGLYPTLNHVPTAVQMEEVGENGSPSPLSSSLRPP